MIPFLRESFAYFATRKKFWILPILFVALLIGGLAIAGPGGAIAPFIYTLF
jgi:hypothetical protein